MEEASKIRRRPEPLLDAPPVYASPAAFLRQVCADMDACAADREYCWCFEGWVEPCLGSSLWAVCAGGAWLARSVGVRRVLGLRDEVLPRLVDEGWPVSAARRIQALACAVEALRTGFCSRSIMHLRMALGEDAFGAWPSGRLQATDRILLSFAGWPGREEADRAIERSLAWAVFGGRPRPHVRLVSARGQGIDAPYVEDDWRHVAAAIRAAAVALEERGA